MHVLDRGRPNLATAYKIKGMNFSITSALLDVAPLLRPMPRAGRSRCSSQDMMFAGWWRGSSMELFFLPLRTQWGPCHRNSNNTLRTPPSRAFDARPRWVRDRRRAARHLVQLLEGYEPGQVRAGAHDSTAEVTGFSRDLRRARHGWPPLVRGLRAGRIAGRAQRTSLPARAARQLINAHRHSPGGRRGRGGAVRRVFGQGSTPPISSEQVDYRHRPRAPPASQEAIYCLLMLAGDFIRARRSSGDPRIRAGPRGDSHRDGGERRARHNG